MKIEQSAFAPPERVWQLITEDESQVSVDDCYDLFEDFLRKYGRLRSECISKVVMPEEAEVLDRIADAWERRLKSQPLLSDAIR